MSDECKHKRQTFGPEERRETLPCADPDCPHGTKDKELYRARMLKGLGPLVHTPNRGALYADVPKHVTLERWWNPDDARWEWREVSQNIKIDAAVAEFRALRIHPDAIARARLAAMAPRLDEAESEEMIRSLVELAVGQRGASRFWGIELTKQLAKRPPGELDEIFERLKKQSAP